MKISAVIITYNEEKNIKRCLDSIKFCSEIIIIDSGSTDKTLSIAKKYGAKVFYKEFTDYSSVKNFGISKAKNQWVLSIDADEEISLSLQQEIIRAVENNYDGYYIRRINYFLGKPIKHGGWGSDYQLRLFKKGKGIFTGAVHESIKLQGKVGYLKEPILHYSYTDSKSYFEKMNRYTSIQAEKLKPLLFFKLLFSPFFKFIKMFFLKLGFLDGLHGFILAIYSSFSEFVKISKMIENKNKINTDTLLIRAPNWIGDCVMVTSFLPELKKKFNKIFIAAKSNTVHVFSNNPYVDGIIEIKPGFRGFISAVSEVRINKIKTAVSFKPSLSSHLFLIFSGVKFKCGYADDMGWLLLNKSYKRKKYKTHVINEYKNILYLLDNFFNFSNIKQELFIDVNKEKKLLKDFKISGKIFTIAPFTAYGPAKQWPLHFFEELIFKILKKKKNISLFILGSFKEKEIKISDDILKDKRVKDVRGCDLQYAMILIKNSCCFIGNDSGLAHIADAFRVPSVIIYGAIPPDWAGPLNKTSKIIYKNLSCQPCFEKKCPYGHYECLNSIKPEEVLKYSSR
ncbi:MAG: lipopolysaccharide heptosyltransferase II [Candidatus Goldbacteria bacterium]|nr:lipopolysaccharide heptosyltransferase II [Candidatus Goldiibacteriota bacterium]